MSMIVVHHLSRKFGRFLAVDSLDFEIPHGQVVGLLGPNGAGKTTTIRMLTGVLAPTNGQVRVDGLDMRRDGLQIRRRIGYLPESAPLYTEMRVVEFLKFRARLFGVRRSKRRSAIDLVLRRLWLNDVRRRPIGQLSRGYRQRVGLAAALLHEPPVLILDEPTVGLDPTQIREMRNLIRELAARHTIVLSTHLLPEAELVCDRLLMMARGRIRAQGTLDELRAQAAQTSRYVVETDRSDVDYPLSRLPGVTEVQQVPLNEAWRRLTITASKSGGDLREPIARTLADHGCLTRELRREAPSLEYLFVQMMAEADVESSAGRTNYRPGERGGGN